MHFGPETFVVRVVDCAMEPAFRRGDFVYVDPDVPMKPGHFVAVRKSGAMTVRLLDEEHGRRALRKLSPDEVDCVLDSTNETMICGVVVCRGRKV